jgi:nitrate/nitrite-specific signal transduction histidine kinase
VAGGVPARLDRVIHDLRNYIFGLRPGMADRHAERLGGHTEIHSTPGQGTRVQVTIPS